MNQVVFNVCVIVAFVIMALSTHGAMSEVKSVRAEIDEVRYEMEQVKSDIEMTQIYTEQMVIWSREW